MMPTVIRQLPGAAAWVVVILSAIAPVLGQTRETVADSLQQPAPQPLPEVVVQGYVSRQSLLRTPASVGVISAQQLRSRSGASLLPALNLLPGVRMEERSPGSYRLSIRGSLLRSPFGIRNVKVYIDELPLTDAGGNTYLNLIDPQAIERVEVLKGPDGSLFGANSGGVVLIDLNGQKKSPNEASVHLTGGAFGLFQESASIKYSAGRSRFAFNQGYQQADGYRQHSALQRHYLQAAQHIAYGKNNSLRLLALYSDLKYQTPGGLTQAQFEVNPKQARPAAGDIPGAVAQQAGIYNQTLLAGITNELLPGDRFRHVVSIFGSHTDFDNPFITNYERRQEKNLGIRTFMEYYGKPHANLSWKWSLGLEGQRGWQHISNFQNDGGQAGYLIAQDELRITQVFYFTRLAAQLGSRLSAEGALSFNTSALFYRYSTAEGERTFANQWMPRFALNYLPSPQLAIRATLSRGYSPPTLAEIRSSNNLINPELQPESGWNQEIGFRLGTGQGRWQADASVFRYHLTEAIVRQLDRGGTEYFLNAGGTRQTGLEAFLSTWLILPRHIGALRSAQLTASYTYSHFLFSDYRVANTDYSGNRLTGVPRSVAVLGLNLQLPQHLSILLELNATSSIPLNDANTTYAKAYQLLQAKVNWRKPPRKRTSVALFMGADNLLNQKYSLGNDINTFGGRFFNAAPLLNVYGGMSLRFE